MTAALHMTPAEIVDMYTHRMEGTEEHRLDVLGALNDCLPTDIAELLDIHGIAVRIDRISAARQLIDDGAEIDEAAQVVGMTYTALRSALYGRGLPHAPRLDADESRALEMYAYGASDREVADAFGVVTSTAREWRRSRGIPDSRIRRRELMQQKIIGAHTPYTGTDRIAAQEG